MASNHSRILSSIGTFAGVVLLLAVMLCFCGYQLRQLLLPAPPAPGMANSSSRDLSSYGAQSKEFADGILITRPSKLSSVEAQQRSKVEDLLAQGNYEMALAAAKSYYNVVELGKTADAVTLMTAALTKAQGAKIAETFCNAQLIDTATTPEASAAAAGKRVLQAVRIDSSVYDQTIEKLRDEPYSTSAQFGCGNLLLLADRPVEARMYFELALQLVAKSNNPKTSEAVRTQEALRALDGIARTIRDENYFALPADTFVLTMRTRAIVQARGANSNTAIMMTDPVCEAAAELAPSGIFNGNPGLASLQSPEDPYVKAANDPSLSAWLNEWQRTRIDIAMLPDRHAQLQQLLGKTRLSCLTLISIGRAISFQSMDDWTEAAFYATAALHGHRELAGYPDGANESRPIIDALNSVQSRLWKIIDGGDLTFVDALYSLNCDLVRWIPADDSDLQDARAYGLIGRAECLWAMGKNDDAVSAAESIDTASMSAQEKQAAAWIYGLTLFSKDRFSEAINQFQVIATDPSYKYSEDAYRFLIVSLARCARTDEANGRLDDWIRRYHPNSQQVKSVLARMGIAPAALSR